MKCVHDSITYRLHGHMVKYEIVWGFFPVSHAYPENVAMISSHVLFFSFKLYRPHRISLKKDVLSTTCYFCYPPPPPYLFFLVLVIHNVYILYFFVTHYCQGDTGLVRL